MRVGVTMIMDNPGTDPWSAQDATLLVGKGQDVKEAKVWQLAPIPPGQGGPCDGKDEAAGAGGAGHIHPQVVGRERRPSCPPGRS